MHSSRELYEVCLRRGGNWVENENSGSTKFFSRCRRPTRHWDRRTSKEGTGGPGNRLSLTTIRDLSCSTAKKVGDAGDQLVIRSVKEVTMWVFTCVSLQRTHTSPDCCAPFAAGRRLHLHGVDHVENILQHSYPGQDLVVSWGQKHHLNPRQ